jgi:hypothetical protein
MVPRGETSTANQGIYRGASNTKHELRGQALSKVPRGWSLPGGARFPTRWTISSSAEGGESKDDRNMRSKISATPVLFIQLSNPLARINRFLRC